MPEKQTRKLAVVMFADIVGYTAMVQQDESAALARVDIHRMVLAQYSEKYHGQIITFYGDGSLSTYPSAIDAVKCALEMQESYRNHDVPIRIGMHLGDIVYKGDSVYGDGVNVASRVEALGLAGSILMTAKLQHEIANHPEIKTKPLGFYKLKNVKKTTELYAVTNPGLNVPTGHNRATIIKRILVRGVWAIALALFVGYFLYDKLYDSGVETGLELRERQVAVRFKDFAKIPDRLEIPVMASHWISNRLRGIPGAHVVNFEDAMDEPEILIASAGIDTRRAYARRTNASILLEGTIYRQGDRLLFEAQIYDLATGENQKDFEVFECQVSDPMQGISDLGNMILGWWATKDDIVYSVPNYTAYQLYLDARNVWREDEKLAEIKLKASISADTTFIDPYFLITELYSNNKDFYRRDSLLSLIKMRFTNLTPRQRSLLDVYEASSRGELVKSYLKYLIELNADPLDVFVNTAGMVEAMQSVNKPRNAIHWFDMIPPESLNMNDCVYCQTRLRMATIAYLKLGKIDSAIYTASLLPATSEKNMAFKLKPYVQLKDTSEINKLINLFNTGKNDRVILKLQTDVAWKFKLNEETDLATYYAELALSQLSDPNETSAITVESNYILGNYEKVKNLIERQWPLSKYPTHDYVLMWTSRVYARVGTDADRSYLRQLIRSSEDSGNYSYGRESYMLAILSLIEGDKDEAIEHLSIAFAQGFQFTEYRYANDIDLVPLFEDSRFTALMNPLMGVD